jgi:uncharacterized lipoprotein YddW (UPF0748 family)
MLGEIMQLMESTAHLRPTLYKSILNRRLLQLLFVSPALLVLALSARPADAQQSGDKSTVPPPQGAGAQVGGATPAPLTLPPAQPPAPYNPLPGLPPITLDEANNGYGIAQQITRSKKLQARVLWIDATANMNAVNSNANIDALVQRIQKTGFNTVVLDVKPIVGYTLYPSKYAPKLTVWKDGNIPADFDPLPEMIAKCHQAGLQLVVSMNTFSEGHRGDNNTVKRQGPGYDHPEWQSTLYTVETRVHPNTPGAEGFPLSQRVNQMAGSENEIAVYTEVPARNGKSGGNGNGFVVALGAGGQVVAQLSGAALGLLEGVPPHGALLMGYGAGADYLRRNAPVGAMLALDAAPAYVPMAQAQDQVPLMVDPNRADVQQRLRDMLTELCTKYEIDGVIFDDRFRYAGINADFSDDTRRQFEAYLAPVLAGKSVHWPDDVFRYDFTFPTLTKRVTPGPYYDEWLTFRALTLRNWLASAVATVKAIRPNATVSTYNGSWYGDSPALGPNWAADDFNAGFRFLTPTYQKTGYAGLTDWMTIGCYYTNPTLADAQAVGRSAGGTVEAAGQLGNRAANDQTWLYAGLNIGLLVDTPEKIQPTVQAALATTQGVMVFDLSYFNDAIWALFAVAFKDPAVAPHAMPGLLAQLRQQHAAHKASGVADPPVIIYNGIPGTGL